MSPEPQLQNYVIVSALLRKQDQILLVEQKAPTDATATWVFPSGRVVVPESLIEGLKREVWEETNLTVETVGPLIALEQAIDTARHFQTFVYLFEILNWSGNLHSNDPDGFILQCEFVAVAEAVQRLSQLPPFMKGPSITWLTEQPKTPSFYYYVDNQLVLRQPLTAEALK